MCGRFAMDKETDELIQEFVAQGGDFRDWRPGYNIPPERTIATVIESAKGGDTVQRWVEGARWSLTPAWSKMLRSKFSTFNARSETLFEKPTWKASAKSKRCLIPIDGYYEWVKNTDGTKTPFYIHLPDHELIALAGLYSWWEDRALPIDEDARWHLTATMLTSDATDEMVEIHGRTPVPLPRDWWDDWLNSELEGDQAFVDAAVQAAVPVAGEFEFYEVAPLRGDGHELIHPAAGR